MLRLLDRLQPLALLVLRCALGGIMVAHGFPKLFRGGMAADVHLVQSIGLPGWMAYLSAGTEFFGGLLLIVGLLTRVASLAVCINMLVAIFKVHLKNGFTGQGNYQFPLALAAMAFALICLGGGPISVDRLFGGRRR
ncbi:MAG TPA: DoxX family protein [Terriglobales bacterium]|nr:DoxX family protein [Terriglobales bacterium]